MPLEDLTGTKYLDSLDEANPLGSDGIDDGDGHIRGVKNVLVKTFANVSGAVTADHTDLNKVDVTYYSQGSGLQSWVVSHMFDHESTAGPLGNLDTANLQIDAIITESSFESVGPTGSGATNIWTGLDNIPLSATGIWMQVRFSLQDASEGNIRPQFWVRGNGASLATTAMASVINSHIYVPAAGLTEYYSHTFYVPVDAANIFECTWSTDADTTENVFIFCRGFTQ